METKECTGCKETKPLDDFAVNKTRKSGRTSRCKVCHNTYYREYWKNSEAYGKHKARVNANRKNYQYGKYGLTREEAEALKASGVCDLCGDMAPLNIDHDHETGAVRGVLCTNCNTGIGKLGDSVEGLRRAIAYLDRKAVVV